MVVMVTVSYQSVPRGRDRDVLTCGRVRFYIMLVIAGMNKDG